LNQGIVTTASLGNGKSILIAELADGTHEILALSGTNPINLETNGNSSEISACSEAVGSLSLGDFYNVLPAENSSLQDSVAPSSILSPESQITTLLLLDPKAFQSKVVKVLLALVSNSVLSYFSNSQKNFVHWLFQQHFRGGLSMEMITQILEAQCNNFMIKNSSVVLSLFASKVTK